MHGGPGKGKTYLSIYLANRWISSIDPQQPNRLVLEYYCDKGNPHRNTALCVLRSLLCQLLNVSNDLYQEILEELDLCRRRNHDLASNAYIETLWRIFKSMVEKLPKNIFFILDGLDECDDDSIKFLQSKLEGFYGAVDAKAQMKFKTIIVSRSLQNKVRAQLIIDLDDLDQEYSEKGMKDLKAFVSENVDRISRIPDECRDNLKQLLLSCTGGTFLWVSLAVSEFNKNTGMLEEVISHPDSVNAWLPKGLDHMYDRILMNIPECRREISFNIIRCICIAMRPLTRTEIAMMVNVSDFEVGIHIRNLENIVRNLDGQFQFIHLSLSDYLRSVPPLTSSILSSHLFNKLLLTTEMVLRRPYLESALDLALFGIPTVIILCLTKGLPFYASLTISITVFYYRFCSRNFEKPLFLVRSLHQHLKIRAFGFKEQEAHEELFERCLVSMEKLRMNGCELEPGTSVTEVKKEKKANYLLHVEYPCRYWMDHLLKTKVRQKDNGNLHNFLSKHFLHWLEVMSLVEELPKSIIVISALQSYISNIENPKLSAFVYDAKQFVLRKQAGIKQAPLQIYSSALFFAPKTNIIWQTFRACIPKWLYEISKERPCWNHEVQILEDDRHEPKGYVCFSLDRTVVLSLSWTGDSAASVRLWDVATGVLQKSIWFRKGPRIAKITFPPDLASSSKLESTIRFIEAVGGNFRYLETVDLTTFSFDSKVIAKVYSDDNTIRLWISKGDHTFEPSFELRGHSKSISRVIFSPNNKLLASSSYDEAIRLWEIKTGRFLHTFSALNCTSIAFSPDSIILATAVKYREICLWNSTTDYQLLWASAQHRNSVVEIKFSPNGKVLASTGHFMRLWNVTNGNLLQEFDIDGLGSSNRITFSPNGEIVASAFASSGIIRLWEASGSLLETLDGHTDEVRSICFSPDGTKLASGSTDGTTRLWNVNIPINRSSPRIRKNRTLSSRPSILQTLYSPNGSLIATLAKAYQALFWEIKIWNSKTGKLNHTLKRRTEPLTKPLFFSPNSEIIALMYSRTVTLSDTASGKHLHMLGVNRGEIRAMPFSPDSTIIILCMSDECQLWNTQTGQICEDLRSV